MTNIVDRIDAVGWDVATQLQLNPEGDQPARHYLNRRPLVDGKEVDGREYLMALGLMLGEGVLEVDDQELSHPGSPSPVLTEQGIRMVKRQDTCLRCASLEAALNETKAIIGDGEEARASARNQVDLAGLAALEAGDAAYIASEADLGAWEAAEEDDEVRAVQYAGEASQAAASARDAARLAYSRLEGLGLGPAGRFRSPIGSSRASRVPGEASE